MRLLLIRHAVTAETGLTLSGRLPGIPLSADGVVMAEELATELTAEPVRALYSSPILRCRQTAKPLGRTWGLTAGTVGSLTEADYGAWSGRKLSALYRLKAWQRLMGAASRFRFPEGETLEEVQRRSVSSVEELADEHGGVSVAVVSHADVIRVLIAHYLGMPLDLIHRLSVAPASLSIIELHESGAAAVPVVNHGMAQGGRH